MMMQDPFPMPSCFAPGEKFIDDPTSPAATKSGQSIEMSVYRTKIAGHCRLITVTWCKNLLVHGLSLTVDGPDSDDDSSSSGNNNNQCNCKVELRPWYFWRKHGSKRFQVDGKPVDVFWDLKNAKFAREPEPLSDYYVAVVSDSEVVLLLGDLKKEAYKRTGSPPSVMDAVLVSKKEHVFGKKRFVTRAKFHDKGKHHEILIECNSSSSSGGVVGGNMDPEMVIKIDGMSTVHVKHLQWKFRGNESLSINKSRVELYWDVHDWLFLPGLRHALFIFKPVSSPTSSTSLCSVEESLGSGSDSSGSCLFLYAWMVE